MKFLEEAKECVEGEGWKEEKREKQEKRRSLWPGRVSTGAVGSGQAVVVEEMRKGDSQGQTLQLGACLGVLEVAKGC